jgi:hypothetical protein
MVSHPYGMVIEIIFQGFQHLCYFTEKLICLIMMNENKIVKKKLLVPELNTTFTLEYFNSFAL